MGNPRTATATCRWPLLLLLAVATILSGLPPLVNPVYADEDDLANMVQVPSRVRIRHGQTELMLSQAGVHNAGIATAQPRSASTSITVGGYGEVLDAATLTDLTSRYRTAMTQEVAAHAKATASRAEYMRVRALYRDRQNMSAAQLQSAQSASQADSAALSAAQSSLSALGATISQAWGPVLAAAVMHDTALMKAVVSRREDLVSVTLPPGIVPESAAPTVRAQLPGGSLIELKFISRGTTVDPRVQGLRYYYSAAAAPGLLSGMTLPITLESTAGTHSEVLIPDSAVVWLQGQPWIYRLVDQSEPSADSGSNAGAGPRHGVTQTFARVPIRPSRQTEDGYVVADVASGSRIVVHGAQLLLSEEFRAQVQSQDND
jgi:hypothetical protein